MHVIDVNSYKRPKISKEISSPCKLRVFFSIILVDFQKSQVLKILDNIHTFHWIG